MSNPAPKKRAIRKRRPPTEIGGFIPVLLIGLVGLGIFKPEAAMFVAVGLVPTIVLALTGKGANHSTKLQCVSFANLAGVVTMIGDVWVNPASVYTLMMEPITLLAMWGAAVFGHALIYVGPQIAAMALTSMSQDRLKQIMTQKQALVEMWGPEVLGEKDDVGPLGLHGRPLNR